MEKTDKPHTTPKGVVDPAGAARRISLRQHAPAPALAHCVDYFWIVAWDLRGQDAQTQRVLPYPNVHLAFEAGQSTLHGVALGPFDKTVAGQGRVLGVRLRPGGAGAFVRGDCAGLTGRVLPACEVLGETATALEAAVRDTPDDAALVAAAQELLWPAIAALAPDPRAALAERAVLAAQAERGPVSVAALAQAVDLDERALQRLFRTYVGVPPKWVIQRFRLQEAAARLAHPEPVDLALLAQELGFFDQAHLTRGFTALVGRAPLEYWKSQQLSF
ncbi:helix-turn-helix domain-containing protein [Pseudoduganella armeniaca]|uniref:helix-turn-helix domain-containing protein n=1 Tax=Pseudoduganella armeniaca TaxID=2072590 RepID=UPI0015E6FA5A|nr:helix-turn-helix domain-containing protein [Pseudoduganella armeniaca]